MLNLDVMQKRIRLWVETRLGVDAMHPHERAMRMLEEALETAQTLGVTPHEVRRLFGIVYGKPPGDIKQELGGAALTLLACAESSGESLAMCIARELERVENAPRAKFLARQTQNAADGIGRPVV